MSFCQSQLCRENERELERLRIINKNLLDSAKLAKDIVNMNSDAYRSLKAAIAKAEGK